jgi:hypothetical protein
LKEREIAVVGEKECYRGTRRYISLVLVSEQRGGGCGDETAVIGVQSQKHVLVSSEV